MPSDPKRYAVSDRKRVPGWFGRVDAEMFRLLTACQNARGLGGSVAEIGLHHGKSFIALCLALEPGERAYGIDVFDSQHLNLDQSGSGVRERVMQNLARADVDRSRVTLDGRSSERVSADDILRSVGRVRFFSVDGGHWAAIVKSDLALAEATLAEHGIIALDDFLRAEWPDVSAGYFDWARGRSRPIVPLAIGSNKLYLCEERFRGMYREVLEASSFLEPYLSKRCSFCGSETLIFQQFPQPDQWSLRTRLREYLKLYHPELYARLRGARLRGIRQRATQPKTDP